MYPSTEVKKRIEIKACGKGEEDFPLIGSEEHGWKFIGQLIKVIGLLLLELSFPFLKER